MLRLSAACRKSLTFSRWALVRNQALGAATAMPDQLKDSSEQLQDTTRQGNSSELNIPTDTLSPQPDALSPRPDTPYPRPDTPTPPPVAAAVLPFRVIRSRQNNLPVYSDYRHGRTKVYTIVRKIEGDIMEMERLLRKHLNKKRLHTRVDELAGQIKIQGAHGDVVKDWLKSLGF